MKLLFLAPQPFFQERGTPIAVRLALEVIAERQRKDNHPLQRIDLLTYHEGSDVEISGVNINRIKPPKFLLSYVKNVGPGVSLKKLICDVFFTFKALKMVWQNRHDQYDCLHAVEESVFIAMIIKVLFGVPYIYDMDSSLALQVTEKWTLLKPFKPILQWFEKIAVRNSVAVAPVCDALGTIAKNHGAPCTYIVRDISLIKSSDTAGAIVLREELKLAENQKIILYVGNLEKYQGIDLLLESFAEISGKHLDSHIIIIGGSEAHLSHYKTRAAELNVNGRVHLTGPRPVEHLGHYILQADILVSPRTKGNNTPMKIYSYLHSGKPLLATRLPTHTQVLDDTVACLTEPTTESFSSGLLQLLNDDKYCEKIGSSAYRLAEENYTFQSFSLQLNSLYDQIGRVLTPGYEKA